MNMDIAGIKKERKTVVACAIWLAVFLGLLLKQMAINNFFTFGKLIVVILGLLCVFHGFRALRKLTDMLYVHSERLLKWYTVLIFVLCWLLIFMPVALIILWNDSKKVLTSGEKLTKQKL